MAIPARVIRELPKLTWRGLFAPCEAAPVDGDEAPAKVAKKAPAKKAASTAAAKPKTAAKKAAPKAKSDEK